MLTFIQFEVSRSLLVCPSVVNQPYLQNSQFMSVSPLFAESYNSTFESIFEKSISLHIPTFVNECCEFYICSISPINFLHFFILYHILFPFDEVIPLATWLSSSSRLPVQSIQITENRFTLLKILIMSAF